MKVWTESWNILWQGCATFACAAALRSSSLFGKATSCTPCASWVHEHLWCPFCSASYPGIFKMQVNISYKALTQSCEVGWVSLCHAMPCQEGWTEVPSWQMFCSRLDNIVVEHNTIGRIWYPCKYCILPPSPCLLLKELQVWDWTLLKLTWPLLSLSAIPLHKASTCLFPHCPNSITAVTLKTSSRVPPRLSAVGNQIFHPSAPLPAISCLKEELGKAWKFFSLQQWLYFQL